LMACARISQAYLNLLSQLVSFSFIPADVVTTH
jgi:hypothetical protein